MKNTFPHWSTFSKEKANSFRNQSFVSVSFVWCSVPGAHLAWIHGRDFVGNSAWVTLSNFPSRSPKCSLWPQGAEMTLPPSPQTETRIRAAYSKPSVWRNQTGGWKESHTFKWNCASVCVSEWTRMPGADPSWTAQQKKLLPVSCHALIFLWRILRRFRKSIFKSLTVSFKTHWNECVKIIFY